MIDCTQTKTEVLALYNEVAHGDAECMAFLVASDRHFQELSDFITTGSQNPQVFIALMARTNLLYSLPFYVRHAHLLHVTVMQSLIGFADGLAWRDQDGWKQHWAETSILALVQVISAVATITLGFDAARQLSPRLKEIAWASRTV